MQMQYFPYATKIILVFVFVLSFGCRLLNSTLKLERESLTLFHEMPHTKIVFVFKASKNAAAVQPDLHQCLAAAVC